MGIKMEGRVMIRENVGDIIGIWDGEWIYFKFG